MTTQLRPLNNSFDVKQQIECDIPCLNCGTCCSRYKVRLSLGEARQICEGLGLSWYSFLGNYVEPIDPEAENFYLPRREGAFIFLQATDKPYRKICLIHAWKPASCRNWMPGLYRKECQEGLQKYWGLAVTEEGRLCGPDPQIRHFQSVFRLADS